MKPKVTIRITLLAFLIVGLFVVPAANADGQVRYQVTIQNLSDGQPFSPPVAATHRASIRIFRPGAPASPELEAIAEDGNQSLLAGLLSGMPAVTEVVDVGRPLTPNGTTVGDFQDHVTFEISARPGDKLSLATMLICTNDGFTGLDRARLPQRGHRTYLLHSYDAGSENNTELSADIVDACPALGPLTLPEDGNENDAVDTQPPAPVQPHPGIQGIGDLTDAHAWTGPVARVTVARIDDIRHYEVTIENLTAGQPLTPPLLTTHSPALDLFDVGKPASSGIQQIAENGNLSAQIHALQSSRHAFDIVTANAPLVPDGTPGGETFADSVTLNISATQRSRLLSYASMLICTNDGFTGLDGLRLPRWVGQSISLHAAGYDAGTELNTEDFADMVPPCQGLIGISSDDPGTGMSNPALAEGGVIQHHPGIAGGADLVPDIHGWDGPVVKITITRTD